MITAEQVLEQIRSQQPVLADEIARAIARETARRVDPDQITRILFMDLRDLVRQDPSTYRWMLAPGAAQQPPPRPSAPPVEPRFAATPDQRRLIQFDPSGALLIRGEAGCGKTTVLAARAGWIQSELGSGSMLLLSYNRSLANYAERLLREAGATSGVSVMTFHQWAKDIAARLGLRVKKWIYDKDRDPLLQEAIELASRHHPGHRLLAQPLNFWASELDCRLTVA